MRKQTDDEQAREDAMLVKYYGSDPRWHNVDGLIAYIDKTYLNRAKLKFLSRLLAAMQRAQ